MSARDEILGRVRAALADVPSGEEPTEEAERTDRRDHGLDAEEAVALFVERASDYRAPVRRVSAAGLREALTEACRARGAQRLAAPADLPPGWEPEGVELIRDEDLSHADLDRVDGVLTGCAAAFAETGTLALDGGPRQGRRALSLLPDYHLCVVEEAQILPSIREGLERLSASARERRPITLVSGPSATSDIELERVEGVHGPRTLEVVVLVGRS
jgi:L-lactate dehydrogenase complex protein LldG